MAVVQVRTVVDPAELAFDDVVSLYESVGWTVYTRDPGTIRAALAGSSFVAGAFLGERLVGLVRAVSDDATISYVQDVLGYAETRDFADGSLRAFVRFA
jgi:predicted GNAT superfamily acetyltransferase